MRRIDRAKERMLGGWINADALRMTELDLMVAQAEALERIANALEEMGAGH